MIQTSAFDELLELQGICECWTRHVGTHGIFVLFTIFSLVYCDNGGPKSY